MIKSFIAIIFYPYNHSVEIQQLQEFRESLLLTINPTSSVFLSTPSSYFQRYRYLYNPKQCRSVCMIYDINYHNSSTDNPLFKSHFYLSSFLLIIELNNYLYLPSSSFSSSKSTLQGLPLRLGSTSCTTIAGVT